MGYGSSCEPCAAGMAKGVARRVPAVPNEVPFEPRAAVADH